MRRIPSRATDVCDACIASLVILGVRVQRGHDYCLPNGGYSE